MPETPNIRLERIERLLHELEYEITRGMLEHEIDETMGFRFVVPLSRRIPEGVVLCQFETRPVHRGQVPIAVFDGPRLKIVK